MGHHLNFRNNDYWAWTVKEIKQENVSEPKCKSIQTTGPSPLIKWHL